MIDISKLLNTIKNAIFGRDMRDAIHDSISTLSTASCPHFVMVCSGGADVINKTVSDVKGFNLAEDTVITVIFTNGHTASSLSLNINGTGDVPVYFPMPSGKRSNQSQEIAQFINPRMPYSFIYRPTGGTLSNMAVWLFCGSGNGPLVDDAIIADSEHPVQNKVISKALNMRPAHYIATCNSTAASTAKTISNVADFELQENTLLTVIFNNGNSAQSFSINVNGTGAVLAYFPTDSGRTYNSTKIAKFINAGMLYTFVYRATGGTGGNKAWLFCGSGNGPLVDDKLNSDSANPVQNKVVKNALEAKADSDHTHTVDNELSSTSTNPVQNKVIKTALDNKADKNHAHTIDGALSSTSTNPVQNKVIKAALDKISSSSGGNSGDGADESELNHRLGCFNFGTYTSSGWTADSGMVGTAVRTTPTDAEIRVGSFIQFRVDADDASSVSIPTGKVKYI